MRRGAHHSSGIEPHSGIIRSPSIRLLPFSCELSGDRCLILVAPPATCGRTTQVRGGNYLLARLSPLLLSSWSVAGVPVATTVIDELDKNVASYNRSCIFGPHNPVPCTIPAPHSWHTRSRSCASPLRSHVTRRAPSAPQSGMIPPSIPASASASASIPLLPACGESCHTTSSSSSSSSRLPPHHPSPYTARAHGDYLLVRRSLPSAPPIVLVGRGRCKSRHPAHTRATPHFIYRAVV
ncbi:hypothetical protein K438DRAFT_1969125 [Mycena galopus ATCC 62051]|nr:hypothetical protein K438DRAFT_1969125 [Mycena galopus ATCC 62051]